MDRIVLAHSGGLDTSVAIPWLRERFGADIITVTMDVGQGTELEAVRDQALAAGAVRAHVLDLREEFARDYVLPALEADAIYGDRRPLAAWLGRALIARKLVDIAGIEHANAVAHGGTETGNEQGRLDVVIRGLSRGLAVIAPAREWTMTLAEKIDYARRRGLQVPEIAESSFNADSNLWGQSIAGGVVDDHWREPPESTYLLIKAPAECPDQPANVEIRFERGEPVAVNGVGMPLVELIASLGLIAAAHGVGRIDLVESRVVGDKSREVYEAPAAVVLHAAHRELQRLVTSRDLLRFARIVSAEYSDVVYDGRWFSPIREALDAFVQKVQQRVTGVVRLKLFKGDCRIVGRQSPYARNHGQALVGRRESVVGSLSTPTNLQ